MIDHKARADVRETINAFLSDRIGADAFDDQLQGVYRKTQDKTVKYAITKLWYIYSDFDDHLVRLDKRGWDAVQRWILLLSSDAEVQVRHKWVWHSSQLGAAAVVAVVCVLLLINFVAALLIGGIVSIALAATRKQIQSSHEATDLWNAWPFPSLAALERTLRRTPAFTKRMHRREIVARGKRPRFDKIKLPMFMEWPLSRVGWCMISPAVLIAQSFPIRISQEVFVESQSESRAEHTARRRRLTLPHTAEKIGESNARGTRVSPTLRAGLRFYSYRETQLFLRPMVGRISTARRRSTRRTCSHCGR